MHDQLSDIDPSYAAAQSDLEQKTKPAETTPQGDTFGENQALLAAIIDSSDDAIVSKTIDGIITSWNKSAENMFGFTAEEVINKHISIIIPESRLDEETYIINKIRSGERISHFETVRKRKDGSDIHISLTVSPVVSRGKIIGASKIARDITERVEIERQKELVTKKLRELNGFKDEFMAMASHELKTPITVARATLEVLDMSIKDSNVTTLLKRAIGQLDKLSRLIGDLLNISKVQSGKLEMNKANYNYVSSIDGAVRNLKLTNQSREIFLHAGIKEVMVNADADRIEQVIINLILNAIKYSTENGAINVTISREGDEVITSVQDYGIGISAADREKVFERFFRGSGVSGTFSGLGIGLYVAREIIQRHGGKIWIESMVGEGSTFYFSLPVLSA
ncbi:MAG: PAS domain-containing sensor histidine kinase [Ginsengibacter sp.]